VARCSNELNATQVRLMVRLCTDKRRQEAVVNIDDASRETLAQHGRQNLHETREDHAVTPMLFKQTGNLFKRGSLVLHIYMYKWNAVPFNETAQFLMIGNYAGYVHLQLPAAPTMQQIVQTVILLAYQYHQALFLRRVRKQPGHAELLRELGKATSEFIRIEGQGIGTYLLSHKEALRFLLCVITRLDDKSAMLRNESAYGGNDACAIRARDSQGVVVGSHAGISIWNRGILTDNA
jgi:hypothetical protein